MDSPLSNTWKLAKSINAIARYDVSETYRVLDSLIQNQMESILDSAL